MTAIIDYGAGNLHSVKNALDFLGNENEVTSDAGKILAADRIILPGVGAFGDAAASLSVRGLDKVVREAIRKGIPILGICLGLHLMFEGSEESEGVVGLGIFKGHVVRIPDRGLKIPHMGWNSLHIKKESKILKDIGEEPYVYFVHSYYPKISDEGIVSASAYYGEELDIAVERDNVFAVQFHPEKSGDVGLQILKNFIEL